MGRIVSGHQPQYYPPLHYFARVQQADVFFLYDDVQFSRGSLQHRVFIRGDSRDWLTIPVRNTGIDTTITDARIDMATPWPARHIRALVEQYGEDVRELTPFYERLCPPVVDPETLRETPDRFDTAGFGTRLDEWIRLDEKWRTQRTKLRALQQAKYRLAAEIGRQKRVDPTAAIDELTAAAEALTAKLECAENTSQIFQTRRDRVLLDISRAFDGSKEIDKLPMAKRWELALDPVEWMGDVKLVDLTIPLLEELFRRLEISTTIVRSSELPVERADNPSEYLARLTEHLGGDRFLSGGVGYAAYLDEAPFETRGLEVIVQDWTPTWVEGDVCVLDVLYGAEDPSHYIR
ncbi:WbqC family protein [Saliphagus infecundisoli]|uniref:WbqC family protein n=1 Tax=Saliphagus infecundisoli TaxID=1849069 RepID=A0ABD5QH47_9EURY|nr:WbqC family protein [Saliphagus infecundisoli]